MCVDDPLSGRMVVAYGEARLHRGDVRARTSAIVEKYYPGQLDAAEEHLERILSAPDRRVLIEIFPSVVIPRRLDIDVSDA